MTYEIVIDFIDKRGNPKILKIVAQQKTTKGEMVRDEKFWVDFLKSILGYTITKHATKKIEEKNG